MTEDEISSMLKAIEAVARHIKVTAGPQSDAWSAAEDIEAICRYRKDVIGKKYLSNG